MKTILTKLFSLMIHSACNRQPSFRVEVGEAYLEGNIATPTAVGIYWNIFTLNAVNCIFSIQTPVYKADILLFPSFP